MYLGSWFTLNKSEKLLSEAVSHISHTANKSTSIHVAEEDVLFVTKNKNVHSSGLALEDYWKQDVVNTSSELLALSVELLLVKKTFVFKFRKELPLASNDPVIAQLGGCPFLHFLALRILKPNIHTQLFNTTTATGVLGNNLLVLMHPLGKQLLGHVVEVSRKTQWLGDWGAEVTTALFDDSKVCLPNHVVIIHDWMVQGQLAVRDVLQHPVHLLLRNPPFDEGEISPKAHVSSDSLSVKHASWEFVPWAPGVAIRMRSALVCFP